MTSLTPTHLLILLPLLVLLTIPVEAATTLKLSKHQTSESRLSGSIRKLQQRTIERRRAAGWQSEMQSLGRRSELEDRAIHIAMHPHSRPHSPSIRYRRNDKRRLDERHHRFDGLVVLENIIQPSTTRDPDAGREERNAPSSSLVPEADPGNVAVIGDEVGVGNVIVSSVYRTVTKTVRPTPVPAPTGVPSVDNPEDLILENTEGLAYTIDVVVEGVPIPVIVDTGSSQFWVPAASCSVCTGYGMTVSPVQLPEDCEIKSNTYGIGSASGCFTRSAVAVGPYEIPDMDLMGIKEVDEALGSSGTVLSGILGLAGETNADGAPTLVKAMYDLGLIKYKTVGFFLSENEGVDSEITFGDVTTSDHADVSQGVTLQSVENDMNLYEVVMDDFGVGGKSVVTGETVIVDTGSSYIYVPEETAKQIYSLLPSPLKAEQGYIIPCNPENPPSLHFKFGGMDFTLDYKYIVGPFATRDGYCWGKIGSLAKMDSWVIGDAFLHTVYTSFNVATREVTLYKLK